MRRQTGLTLIETLIAAMIMFSALIVASLAVKVARQSSERAEQQIELYTPLMLVVDLIKAEVGLKAGSDKLQGEGNINGIGYSWQASIVNSAAPPPRFDPDTLSFETYKPRFYLYQVTLTLQSAQRVKSIQYQELAWSGQHAEL